MLLRALCCISGSKESTGHFGSSLTFRLKHLYGSGSGVSDPLPFELPKALKSSRAAFAMSGMDVASPAKSRMRPRSASTPPGPDVQGIINSPPGGGMPVPKMLRAEPIADESEQNRRGREWDEFCAWVPRMEHYLQTINHQMQGLHKSHQDIDGEFHKLREDVNRVELHSIETRNQAAPAIKASTAGVFEQLSQSVHQRKL